VGSGRWILLVSLPTSNFPLPTFLRNQPCLNRDRLACSAVEGAFFLISALLLVSGGSKVSDPGPTTGALRATGLPSSRVFVFLLGAGEIALGAGSLIFGGEPAGWAVAALYLGFAVFVVNALIRNLPIGSCGCFGKADTPPTLIHVVVNVFAAAVAAWAAIIPASPLIDVLGTQPVAGVPYLAFLAAGTYLLYLLLAELPHVIGLRRPVSR
jgi:hypothetical protein